MIVTDLKELNLGKNEMKYIYEKKQRKILSSKSGVWIQLCGANREGPEEFVLHAKGVKVGFTGPSDSSERAQSGDRNVKDITIGGAGVKVCRWEGTEGKNKITYCDEYSFLNRDEQTLLIGLIKDGLSVYTPISQVTVAVHLSKKLQAQIESGVLIK